MFISYYYITKSLKHNVTIRLPQLLLQENYLQLKALYTPVVIKKHHFGDRKYFNNF